MVADAKAGKFFKIIVLRASRLGREEIDLLTTYNLFVDVLGIELIGVAEPLGDRTMFGFQSIMAGYARRQFLADSARGMERAAKEGRYTGGIVPLGYRVDGRRQTARLIPDETIIWGDWTAADLVRRIYHWLGVEERSCRWIAKTQPAQPPSYHRDGVCGQAPQGLWRQGRIHNLLVDAVQRHAPTGAAAVATRGRT
jgi:site-specific DNA recombinase